MLRAKLKPPHKTKTWKATQPTFVGQYLVADPRVCHGKMTFRGTRVPVKTILAYLAKGHSLAYLHKSWPEVPAEAIAEAVRLAAELFVQHYQAAKP